MTGMPGRGGIAQRLRLAAATLLACSISLTANAQNTQTLGGGEVAQDVIFIPDPSGAPAPLLVAAYAFSGTVVTYRADNTGVYHQLFSTPVGTFPGLRVDLPRRLVSGRFTRGPFEDVLVVNSGTTSTGVPFPNAGSVQVLQVQASGRLLPLAPFTFDLWTGGEFSLPTSAAVGDAEGDGVPDVLVGFSGANAAALLVPRGAGMFQRRYSFPIIHPGTAVAFANLEGASSQTVLIAGGRRVALHQRTPLGGTVTYLPSGFVELASDVQGEISSIAVADFDASGRHDVVAATSMGWIQIFRDLHPSGVIAGTEAFRAPAVPTSASSWRLRDLAVGDWQGDGRPDLFVVDAWLNQVLIYPTVSSTTSPIRLPAPALPRRMALGDVDGNGLPDVAVATEADTLAQTNGDVRLTRNGNLPNSNLELVLRSRASLAPNFPHTVSAWGGVVAGSHGRNIVLEPARGRVVLLDDDGEIRDSLDLRALGITEPSAIAAAIGDSLSELWVAEAGTTRVRIVRNRAIVGTWTLSAPGGALGITGLSFARWPSSPAPGAPLENSLFVLCSSQRTVHRVLSSSGAIRWTSPALGTDFTSIAADGNERRLLLGNPFSDSVEEFSISGAGGLQSVGRHSVAGGNAALRGKTPSGLAVHPEDRSLLVLTTDGLLVKTGATGHGRSGDPPVSNTEVTTLRRGMNYRSLSVNAKDAVLYALDSAGLGFVDAYDFGGRLLRTFRTDAAVEALPESETFLPASLAFDPTTNEVLVATQQSPRIARFSESGNFLGFLNWQSVSGPSAAAASISYPILGISVDETSGHILIRGSREVTRATRSGQRLSVQTMMPDDVNDLDGLVGTLYQMNPRYSRIEILSNTTTLATPSVALNNFGAGRWGSLAVLEANALRNPAAGSRRQFFALSEDTGELLRLEEPGPPAAATGAWLYYGGDGEPAQ